MKNLNFIFISIGLLFSIISSGQTVLTFRLSNPKLAYYTTATPDIPVDGNYFEFDVQIKANALQYFYSGEIALSFNSLSLYGDGSEGWIVSKGAVLSGTTGLAQKYNILPSTIISGVYKLPFAGNTTSLNRIPFRESDWNQISISDFETLVTIKVYQSGSATDVAGIDFDNSMNGQFSYITGSSTLVAYGDNVYDSANFTSTYLGRIFANSVWTQIGGTLDWSSSVNTSVWDGNAEIPTSGESKISALRIHDGAKLTVSATGSVTISGTTEIIPTNDGFIVESDNSQSGSVIFQNTVTGNVQYNRYVSGINKWHLIASTAKNQTISNFLQNNEIATNEGKYGLAVYNNTDKQWVHYATASPPATNFQAGQGYELLRTSDGNIAFLGNPHSSDYSIDITDPDGGNNWNLVGNSFLSAINANSNTGSGQNFLSLNSNSLDENYEAVYIWDANSSVYNIINQLSSASYIPPGQAFFIYSKSGGATLNYLSSMLTHQTGVAFKDAVIPDPSIKLIAEMQGKKSKTEIVFKDGMTIGLDPGYDAGRFALSDNSFALYTKLVDGNEVDFAIQCLPENQYDQFGIAVGLNAMRGSEILFSSENIQIPANVDVVLEDRVLGINTNLNTTSDFYKVLLTEGSYGYGRFFIHTKQNSTATKMTSDSECKIYPVYRYQIVRIAGSNLANSQISLFTIEGKLLLTKRLTGQTINDIPMNGYKQGIYLISIANGEKIYQKKIAWVQ